MFGRKILMDRIEELRCMNNDSLADIQRLKQSRETYAKENGDLLDEVNKKDKEIKELKEKLAKSEAREKCLERDIISLEKEKERLNGALEGRVTFAEEENRHLKEEKFKLLKERATLVEDNAMLRTTLDMYERFCGEWLHEDTEYVIYKGEYYRVKASHLEESTDTCPSLILCAEANVRSCKVTGEKGETK